MLPLPIVPLVHVIRPLRIPLVPARVPPARIRLEIVPLIVTVPPVTRRFTRETFPLRLALPPAKLARPGPVALKLSPLKDPPVKLSCAPAATLPPPPREPPPARFTVPLCTSTVPVLLKVMEMVVVPAPPDLRPVPWLTTASP